MKKKTTSQRFAYIPLTSIEPSEYQRATSPSQVGNIVNNFDEAKLGTLTVSTRNGRHFIIDGQHRLSALRILNYTHALCETLTGLTAQQEADLFRRQDQDKRALKPPDLFKAGIVARDEKCLRINKIVKSNGFRIGFSCKDFYQIAAIHALFTIVDDYGFNTLNDTLCLLANTWAGIAKATSGDCLLGVAEFVHRYGTYDFDKRLCDSFYIVWYEYREAISRTQQSLKARKIFCRILVSHYNKGLPSNSKQRLKREDYIC